MAVPTTGLILNRHSAADIQQAGDKGLKKMTKRKFVRVLGRIQAQANPLD